LCSSSSSASRLRRIGKGVLVRVRGSCEVAGIAGVAGDVGGAEVVWVAGVTVVDVLAIAPGGARNFCP